jgi:hypothetical protein
MFHFVVTPTSSMEGGELESEEKELLLDALVVDEEDPDPVHLPFLVDMASYSKKDGKIEVRKKGKTILVYVSLIFDELNKERGNAFKELLSVFNKIENVQDWDDSPSVFDKKRIVRLSLLTDVIEGATQYIQSTRTEKGQTFFRVVCHNPGRVLNWMDQSVWKVKMSMMQIRVGLLESTVPEILQRNYTNGSMFLKFKEKDGVEPSPPKRKSPPKKKFKRKCYRRGINSNVQLENDARSVSIPLDF